MPAKTRLPTPLSASVGLVATAVEEARQAVRRAPQRAVRLPLQLLAGAVLWNERVRARYDELAERGERVVERLRSRGSGAAGRPAYGAAEGLADVRDLTRSEWAPAGGTATSTPRTRSGTTARSCRVPPTRRSTGSGRCLRATGGPAGGRGRRR